MAFSRSCDACTLATCSDRICVRLLCRRWIDQAPPSPTPISTSPVIRAGAVSRTRSHGFTGGVHSSNESIISDVRGQESGVRGQEHAIKRGVVMAVRAAKELGVYLKAYALAMRIFEVSKRFPKEETY